MTSRALQQEDSRSVAPTRGRRTGGTPAMKYRTIGTGPHRRRVSVLALGARCCLP
ncbi:hypothetical protein GTW38_21505 [Streptomyces sp. SID7804]|nr:hypothetical protein [Streptomyces sp. SID7804]